MNNKKPNLKKIFKEAINEMDPTSGSGGSGSNPRDVQKKIYVLVGKLSKDLNAIPEFKELLKRADPEMAAHWEDGVVGVDEVLHAVLALLEDEVGGGPPPTSGAN